MAIQTQPTPAILKDQRLSNVPMITALLANCCLEPASSMCRITPTTVATNTESEVKMKEINGTSEMQISKGNTVEKRRDSVVSFSTCNAVRRIWSSPSISSLESDCQNAKHDGSSKTAYVRHNARKCSALGIS